MLIEFQTLLLFFILSLRNKIVSATALCPDDYDDVGSGCLYTPNVQLTYVEAQDLCHSSHGELAVLSDCQSFSDAVHYVEEDEAELEHGFWIGATYTISSGEWQWRDGSTVALGIPYWGQSDGGESEPFGGSCSAYCHRGNFYFGAYLCTEIFSPLCAALPSSDGFCNLPFVAVGSQCVAFGRNIEHDWEASRVFCQDAGGDLLVFETCQQYIDVSEYIEKQGLTPNVSYWLGGFMDELTQEWIWNDGSHIPQGVPFWGQYPESALLPNNSTAERCLELGATYRHRFNDLGCMELRRPLCMATPLE